MLCVSGPHHSTNSLSVAKSYAESNRAADAAADAAADGGSEFLADAVAQPFPDAPHGIANDLANAIVITTPNALATHVCADAQAHVHKFNENTPQGTKKASSGTTKMHALNMAAACVKRAADMAAQASELAEVAIQRAIDMKKKGAPQAAVDKADATGIVVRDAAAAAAFDAQNTARAFKTTSKIGRA